MNDLKVMSIDGVDCYEENGTVYLKLENVARGLGFTRVASSGNEVVRWERVDKYLQEFGVPTCGHEEFIPENIFYRLAMKAKNEAAEKFQALVADEIIPSIRKHGMYATEVTIDRIIEDPDFGIELLTKLKEERKKNRELEAENQLLTQVVLDYEPKVTYYDTILSSDDTMVVTQIAADYGMTAQQLNKILKKENIQHKVNGQWVLRKEYMGEGYTDSRTYNFEKKDGSIGVNVQTRWTQKGRILIHELLEKRGIRPVMDIIEEEENRN